MDGAPGRHHRRALQADGHRDHDRAHSRPAGAAPAQGRDGGRQ
jgi:hypothetical protein